MTSVADPREEVKKLQDLVKQLELQNAQLRSKQHHNVGRKEQSPPLRKSPTIPSTQATTRLHSAAYNRRRNSGSVVDKNDNIAKASLEDVDIIDVNVLDLSDEDSWLFKSPKNLTEEEKSISPYKWMRRDVEDPDNVELQTVKRALVNKLDEIARARFAGIEELRSPVQNQPEKQDVPLYKPLIGHNRVIDSRTFTRPRKRNEDYSANPKIPFILDIQKNPEPVANPPTEAQTPEDEGLSTASDSSFSNSTTQRLADVVDVQALARMQEESLREHVPTASPRRNSASTHQRAATTTTPSIKNYKNLVRQTNINDPGKRRFSYQKPEDSLEDSVCSDTSANSESLQTPESYDEEPTTKSTDSQTGPLRRSIPSLSKNQNGSIRNASNLNSSFPQHGKESRLPNPAPSNWIQQPPQQQAHDGNLSKEGTPTRDAQSRVVGQSNVRRDSHPSNQVTFARSHSPGPRSGIPQLRRNGSPASNSPRSCLPKPLHSRIPPPRGRSSLPAPTRSSTPQSFNSDESWKDGCF